ncbi:MAG: hypothetical protein JNL66_20190 [Alphaproteobacteria bacterium]|nr:hypothetical protein [Alphaproteobacteria bacterium]
MPKRMTVVLFERDAPTHSRVQAVVEADGGVTIDAVDAGPLVREVWGDDDYEYALKVPAAQKDRLLLALLRRHYGGHANAFAEIRTMLNDNAIAYDFDSWA